MIKLAILKCIMILFNQVLDETIFNIRDFWEDGRVVNRRERASVGFSVQMLEYSNERKRRR